MKLYIIHSVCGVGINMTGHQAWRLINLVCNELTLVGKELQITKCCQSQLITNYRLNNITVLEKFPYMHTVFYCFLIYLCLGSKKYIFAWFAVMKFSHLRASKTPSVLMLPAWHVFMFIPESSLVMHGENCDIEVMQRCLLFWIWGSDSGGYEDCGHLGCYAV
jgi:hypothetical protein